ncbi:serine/threonine-protein kinase [Pontiellaceae bacterium B12227]|nr:serine/threonine-protein kinase [Pontiellaceae bacterium B12227]
MEQHFLKRKKILGALQDTPLATEGDEALTPILNALMTPEMRYDAPELLAEGGEKRIFRAFDHHLNRHVAMAQAAHAETPEDQERFLREGQLTANLTHPNIVPIHNMGIASDGAPFFSMELVPGDSLRDIIEKLKAGDPVYKTRYTLKDLLDIFNKVCDALAYAHSRNVLHLDIKPDNIRVGQFGEVLLCDWGLARIEGHIDSGEAERGQLDSDLLNDMTLTGTMKGTPGFMAPEQVMNQEKSRQTDIYALGAILYLILTHQLPVDGKTVSEVVENTRKGNVIHPRKCNLLHPVPVGLAAVAMQALAFEPDKRYASVKNLQSDINRFLTGFPTTAEQAGLFHRMALLTQRHRNLTMWLMTFFILLILVMSISLSIIHRGKQLAEENFVLYKTQQEQANRINEKLSALSFSTKNVLSYVSARSMIQVAEQLLEHNTLTPDRKQDIQVHKARMHMVLQEFNAATSTFQSMEDPEENSPGMLDVCRKFAAIKPDDTMLLSDQDLARFLTTHYKILPRSLALYTYYHDRQRNRSSNPEDHIAVAGAMLARLNQINSSKIPELKLSKGPEGYHLNLTHTPYSVYIVGIPLVYGKNVLQPLNLYSLDISHTPISLVRELWELKVKKLRMVGVILEPTEGMAGMLKHMGAEQVILGKGDYSEGTVNYIRKQGIEVIEEGYEL